MKFSCSSQALPAIQSNIFIVINWTYLRVAHCTLVCDIIGSWPFNKQFYTTVLPIVNNSNPVHECQKYP